VPRRRRCCPSRARASRRQIFFLAPRQFVVRAGGRFEVRFLGRRCDDSAVAALIVEEREGVFADVTARRFVDDHVDQCQGRPDRTSEQGAAEHPRRRVQLVAR
jgi:hypothetical protein